MDRRLKERLVGAAILVFFAVLFIPELLSGPARPRGLAQEAPAEQVPTGAASSLRTYTVDLEHPAAGAVLAPRAASGVGGRTAMGEVAAGEGAASEVATGGPAASEAAPGSAGTAPAGRVVPTPSQPRASPAEARTLDRSNSHADPAHEATPSASGGHESSSAPPAKHEAALTSPAARTGSAASPPAHEVRSGAVPHAAAPASNTFAPIDARGGWSLQLGSFSNRANAEKLAQNLRAKGIRVYVSSGGAHHRVRAGPFPDRASAERAAGKLRTQGHATSIVPP